MPVHYTLGKQHVLVGVDRLVLTPNPFLGHAVFHQIALHCFALGDDFIAALTAGRHKAGVPSGALELRLLKGEGAVRTAAQQRRQRAVTANRTAENCNAVAVKRRLVTRGEPRRRNGRHEHADKIADDQRHHVDDRAGHAHILAGAGGADLLREKQYLHAGKPDKAEDNAQQILHPKALVTNQRDIADGDGEREQQHDRYGQRREKDDRA